MKSFGLVVVFCLMLFSASAQPINVTTSTGAGSDVINGIIATPDGKLFAGTDNGLLVSSDEGLNWDKANASFANSSITALKIHNNQIYAASNSELYRSLDNGSSWELLNSKIGVRSMAFTPSDYIVIDGFNLYGNLLIQISFDNGKTWRESFGEPSNLKIQNNPRGDIFRKGDYYLYRLDYADNGYCYQSYCWQYLTNGYNFGEARSFVILSDDYMLSSTDKAILYSIYRGSAWGKLADESFSEMGADNYGRVFGDNKISLDSGKTWKVYFNDSTFKNINQILSTKKGFVYYASSTDGIKFTTDDGLTWHRVTHRLSETSFNEIHFYNKILYVGTEKGVYISKDKTLSWYPLNNGLTNKMDFTTFEQKNNGDLLAYIKESGFWTYSFSAGLWQKNSFQITPNVRKILKVKNGNILTVTESGVFISLDDGDSWQEINSNITDKDLISLSQGTDGMIYMGSQGGIIYRMDLPTQTLTAINDNISLGYPVTSISQNPGGDIFAATLGGGIFRQKAGGNHFIESNLQLGVYDLTSVYATKDNYVVAGWKYGTYSFSNDNGEFWSEINPGMSYYNKNNPIINIISDEEGVIYFAKKNSYFIILKNLYEIENYQMDIQNQDYSQHSIHSSDINQIKFSKLDSVFFTAGSDGFVREWRMLQNSYYVSGIYHIIRELKFKNPVTSIDLSKDEKKLLVGTCRNDTALTFVYDLENEKYIAEIKPGISSRESKLNYLKNIVKFSYDNEYILNSVVFSYSNKGTSNTSGDLTLWSSQSYTLLRKLDNGIQGGVLSIAMPSSGTNIAVSYDSTFQVISPKTDPIHTDGVAMIDYISGNVTFLNNHVTKGQKVSNVFISKDNSLMIARCNDTLYVWDYPSGNLKSNIYNIKWNFSNVMLSDNNVYLIGIHEPLKQSRIWALNNQRFYDRIGYYDVNSIDISDDSRTYLFAVGGSAFWIDIEMITNIDDSFVTNKNSLNINPNPAKDYIGITKLFEGFEFSEGSSNEVIIFNVFGQEILKISESNNSQFSIHNSQFRIDVSGLPSGLYFVRFGDKVSKFLKI